MRARGRLSRPPRGAAHRAARRSECEKSDANWAMRSPDGAVVVFASGVHVANLDEGAANWHLGRSKGDPQGPTAMLALISSTLSFNGAAPMLQPAPQSASPVMKAIGEIGVTPPLGVYDPLNISRIDRGCHAPP